VKETPPVEQTAAAPLDVSAAATASEPQYIEIWRPGRKERDQHPPRHHRRPQREKKPATATPAAAQPTAETNGAAAGQQQPAQQRQQHRHGREDGERRDRRPRREGRRDNRERDDNRRDDRAPRQARGAETVRFSTEPSRGDKRSRPADPNSPFAALAALKAELEAKERGG
jgi:ATP-dependent RNA helicase SUPV3L1/SUV3